MFEYTIMQLTSEKSINWNKQLETYMLASFKAIIYFESDGGYCCGGDDNSGWWWWRPHYGRLP